MATIIIGELVDLTTMALNLKLIFMLMLGNLLIVQ